VSIWKFEHNQHNTKKVVFIKGAGLMVELMLQSHNVKNPKSTKGFASGQRVCWNINNFPKRRLARGAGGSF